MAKKIGSDGAITINGVTVGVTSWSYNLAKDLGEVTEVGDVYKKFKPTMRGATGSVVFILDPTIPTQKTLIEQGKTGIADAQVEMKLYYDDSTLDMLHFYAWVASIDMPQAANGVVQVTVNYTQEGALLSTPTGTTGPILLTAIATDATSLILTFDINIEFQTAFAAGHYSATVNGSIIAPTAGSITDNALDLTFGAASFANGDTITLTVTGIALQDTDATPDTYGGVAGFAVTNSVPA